MHLQTEFPNGCFGDPALYVSQLNSKSAMLFDCGDLTRFSTRTLLKIDHIFLSHCHIDHFFGFDLFLRVHVGVQKRTCIYGPPATSERVEGKLQGYTWNLIYDQDMEFLAIDLDVTRGKKKTTLFHARDRFRASKSSECDWDPKTPVHEEDSFEVFTTMLDHRTPSMAYAVIEKESMRVNADLLPSMGLRAGAWINELKALALENRLDGAKITVSCLDGTSRQYSAKDLASKLLTKQEPNKIAYATDGAASIENGEKLSKLIEGANLFYSETCFLQKDVALADETKHFTAEFIAKLASSSKVKSLAPFHFSKRYLADCEPVFEEIRAHFAGKLVHL